jgi:hypothetical protein
MSGTCQVAVVNTRQTSSCVERPTVWTDVKQEYMVQTSVLILYTRRLQPTNN